MHGIASNVYVTRETSRGFCPINSFPNREWGGVVVVYAAVQSYDMLVVWSAGVLQSALFFRLQGLTITL